MDFQLLQPGRDVLSVTLKLEWIVLKNSQPQTHNKLGKTHLNVSCGKARSLRLISAFRDYTRSK